MSAFKRAEWKSGLTYFRTCDQCKISFTYMDDKLDFRPWFPDGFVYCPSCKKPLRHNEDYATNNVTQTVDNPIATFCSQCGYKFDEADRFCPQCGKKR